MTSEARSVSTFYSWTAGGPGRRVSACMTAHAMERATQPTLAARPLLRCARLCVKQPPAVGRWWPDSYNKGTHNADSMIKSKVIYYLEQCRFGV